MEFHTIPTMFLDKVERFGERVALREKKFGIWEEISWNRYKDHAACVSMGLLALGLERGEITLILSENCQEWFYCDLGTMCAGGIAAGIYPTSSYKQVKYYVNHSHARIIFVENDEQLDKTLQILDDTPNLEHIVVFDMKGLQRFNHDYVMSFKEFQDLGKKFALDHPELRFEKMIDAIRPEDTAAVVYTSGTTGDPKAVMLSHKNIIFSARYLAEQNELHFDHEVLSFLPLSHIGDRMLSFFVALMIGYTVNIVESPDTVLQNMVEVRPHFLGSVPRMWEKFFSRIVIRKDDATWFEKKVQRWGINVGRQVSDLTLKKKPIPFVLRLKHLAAERFVIRKTKELLGLERAKTAFCGAAPASPKLLEFFSGLGIKIKEGYGQTESSLIISIHNGDNIKYGTVGQPHKSIQVKIANDGEILVKGPNVFQGYYRDPEATKETIVDGWLHTGDCGEFDEDGYLKLTDRKKDIIIPTGGHNVAPQYIENKLKLSPYINDAVIIGDKRKYITALIMLDLDNVTKYAQDHGIPFTTYQSLALNPDINKLIGKEIDSVNEELDQVEKIKKFKCLDIQLTSDDEEITATMKLKRKSINERFKHLIDEMYAN